MRARHHRTPRPRRARAIRPRTRERADAKRAPSAREAAPKRRRSPALITREDVGIARRRERIAGRGRRRRVRTHPRAVRRSAAGVGTLDRRAAPRRPPGRGTRRRARSARRRPTSSVPVPEPAGADGGWGARRTGRRRRVGLDVGTSARRTPGLRFLHVGRRRRRDVGHRRIRPHGLAGCGRRIVLVASWVGRGHRRDGEYAGPGRGERRLGRLSGRARELSVLGRPRRIVGTQLSGRARELSVLGRPRRIVGTQRHDPRRSGRLPRRTGGVLGLVPCRLVELLFAVILAVPLRRSPDPPRDRSGARGRSPTRTRTLPRARRACRGRARGRRNASAARSSRPGERPSQACANASPCAGSARPGRFRLRCQGDGASRRTITIGRRISRGTSKALSWTILRLGSRSELVGHALCGEFDGAAKGRLGMSAQRVAIELVGEVRQDHAGHARPACDLAGLAGGEVARLPIGSSSPPTRVDSIRSRSAPRANSTISSLGPQSALSTSRRADPSSRSSTALLGM